MPSPPGQWKGRHTQDEVEMRGGRHNNKKAQEGILTTAVDNISVLFLKKHDTQVTAGALKGERVVGMRNQWKRDETRKGGEEKIKRERESLCV